jgi:hypothetical protein
MKTPTTASNNGNNASFVNHGLTLWTERGQECASSQQHSRPQESGEPLISWSANDDELLVPNRPFPQSNHLPVSLSILTWMPLFGCKLVYFFCRESTHIYLPHGPSFSCVILQHIHLDEILEVQFVCQLVVYIILA